MKLKDQLETKPISDLVEPSHTHEQYECYDPNELPYGFSLLMLGRRRTGKTHGLGHILATIKDRFQPKDVFLFSGTALYQDDAFNYLLKDNRITGLQENKLSEIWEEQNSDKRQGKELTQKLIILDDIIADSNFKKSETLHKLFISSRHVGICLVTLSQSINGREALPSIYRSQCDVIMSFFLHSERDQELLAGNYISTISKKVGIESLKQITNEKFTMVVVDLSIQNVRKNSDFLRVYCAPEQPAQFKFGQQEDIETVRIESLVKPGKLFQWHIAGTAQDRTINRLKGGLRYEEGEY